MADWEEVRQEKASKAHGRPCASVLEGSLVYDDESYSTGFAKVTGPAELLRKYAEKEVELEGDLYTFVLEGEIIREMVLKKIRAKA